ncbi:hypothetical protein SARC_09296 [Sphaeroforma arctica JP610]|uniref:Uncharacterized protein n=1 Tax=Sphaeroforma arctica JP610 TaxID=667725 RepID=A0A0L0FQI9_9EUKA|nr:hypothetical protein SARC_09296 [Sphaeroforma arctica JP610]KNC78268.1 hypothetical protein SARC_09296 [Sphaeroforma arctica JP610]|eukprot:XP_014152170.1 hypothetical protein SARC_09296 [Sphaeroforma arctica JP610]
MGIPLAFEKAFATATEAEYLSAIINIVLDTVSVSTTKRQQILEGLALAFEKTFATATEAEYLDVIINIVLQTQLAVLPQKDSRS